MFQHTENWYMLQQFSHETWIMLKETIDWKFLSGNFCMTT